jgi:hypothetical protein
MFNLPKPCTSIRSAILVSSAVFAFAATLIKRQLLSLLVFLAASLLFFSQPALSQPIAWDGGIRGVLLVGKFRTQKQLNGMFAEEQRNTLITELANRTKDLVGHYQSLNDADLAGAGALLAYLRHTGSRTDQQLKTMSVDDMRNTVIVEVGAQTKRGRDLQALRNIELIRLVLGRESYIRGVLLVGNFRTQQQLNGMSPNGQRNTLITELANRTKDLVGHYQSLNDADLAGAGALLVYLRHTGSRTDQQLKTMSADDMRNTVIVEVGAQTQRGRDLQRLSNMEVVKLVLKEPTKYLN